MYARILLFCFFPMDWVGIGWLVGWVDEWVNVWMDCCFVMSNTEMRTRDQLRLFIMCVERLLWFCLAKNNYSDRDLTIVMHVCVNVP